MAEPTVVTDAMLAERWPLEAPEHEATKDERGKVLVVGGARSTPGAVLLAGLAALRVGAGKLTIATCDVYAATLGVEVPEAGVFGLPTTAGGGLDPSAAGQVAELAADVDAVLFGPGMTEPENTRALIGGVMKAVDGSPVFVLDAMAATCGALDDSGPNWVITPNTPEAGYLLDDTDGEDHDIALRLAERYGVTAVLGDATATPDGRVFAVPKGNPGLGTSGSGDVLAGAVAGVAARTGDPLTAALWGLALHGEAGDRLAARVGRVGFLARELLDELPGCLRDLTADRGADS
ncbi:MAG: NAD(P)H-hydrate dehydratase [Frankiaceae bacterium]|nr:NAD(P)H-hydrate dehydratase [Frankiaceae bacterium]MBV9369392.1 NAD(P)H-hydrate dehydratase [Frankiales bacterium]